MTTAAITRTHRKPAHKTNLTRDAVRTALHYVPLLASLGWLIALLSGSMDIGVLLIFPGFLAALLTHPIRILRFMADPVFRAFRAACRTVPFFPANLGCAMFAAVLVELVMCAIVLFLPGVLTLRWLHTK